jgi:hypothetical protein
MKISNALANKFWALVKKRSGSGCWLWMGWRVPTGYGTFAANRKLIRAHRFAWILSHGDIPAGMCVLHKCDNPSCVRPDHLWLGTHLDNMRDMNRKGRRIPATGLRNGANTKPDQVLRGERHCRARFTDAQVLDIRRRIANGERNITIAREFGVSKGAISGIVNGRTWRHLLPVAIDGKPIEKQEVTT